MSFSDPTQQPPAGYFLAGSGSVGKEPTPELALELELALDAASKQGSGKRGIYTAERFREREPRRYALVVTGLAQGYSKQALARAMGLAWETVRAIERAEGERSIRDEKKGFADGLADVIEIGIEGLRDKALAGKLSALDVAVLTDKFLTLRGEASSIIETRGEDPAVTAYREFMRAMGSEAGDVFAKGAAARAVVGAVVEMAGESGAGGVEPLAPVVQPSVDQVI